MTITDYLSPTHAARILHTTPWVVYLALIDGRLTGFRPDGERRPWLIRPADLRAYVEGAAA